MGFDYTAGRDRRRRRWGCCAGTRRGHGCDMAVAGFAPARNLLRPLPDWVPDPEAMDDAERGHRGTLARRLVEHLLERQSGVHARRGSVTGLDGDATLWRKLRRRLQE